MQSGNLVNPVVEEVNPKPAGAEAVDVTSSGVELAEPVEEKKESPHIVAIRQKKLPELLQALAEATEEEQIKQKEEDLEEVLHTLIKSNDIEKEDLGAILRMTAWDLIDSKVNWPSRDEHINDLLEAAAEECDDVAAKLCVKHELVELVKLVKLEKLERTDFLFQSLSFLSKAKGDITRRANLFKIVVYLLPPHYQAARNQLLQLLENDIDGDAYAKWLARASNLQKEWEELEDQSDKLEFVKKIKQLAKDKKFAAFTSTLNGFAQQLRDELKKHFLKDFSDPTVAAYDEKALFIAIAGLAQQHIKDVKALVDAQPKLAGPCNELSRKIASIFGTHSPEIAYLYLMQIPTSDLAMDDIHQLASLPFKLQLTPIEQYQLAMPYALKMADKPELVSEMETMRGKAINFDVSDRDKAKKGESLLQMSWDYIAMGKDWQLERVLPLWKAAVRCGNPVAQFCIDHVDELEEGKFFFECTQHAIKRHAAHFNEIAPLIVDTNGLPPFQQQARKTLLTLLSDEKVLAAQFAQYKTDLEIFKNKIERKKSLLKDFNEIVAELTAKRDILIRQSQSARGVFISELTNAMTDKVTNYLWLYQETLDKPKKSELCNQLVNEMVEKANQAIQLDKFHADWYRQAVFAVGVKLKQQLFPKNPLLNSLVESLRAYVTPEYTKLGMNALVKRESVSWFEKHRTLLAVLGVGLLALLITGGIGGMLIAPLAGLLIIQTMALAISATLSSFLIPFTVTATMLTGVIVGAAVIASGAVASLITLGVDALVKWRESKKEPEQIEMSVLTSLSTVAIRGGLALAGDVNKVGDDVTTLSHSASLDTNTDDVNSNPVAAPSSPSSSLSDDESNAEESNEKESNEEESNEDKKTTSPSKAPSP